jgi:CRP-like cAMP-binding protein
MLILLSGQLSVLSEAGDVLAHIEPGATVGEMGVFTDAPRSANIVSTKPANAITITISKTDFFRYLQATSACWTTPIPLI